MMNGTEKLSYKTPRMRNHIGRLFVPDSPRRVLYHTGLAGSRNYCYHSNSGCLSLQNLEAKARFQLVMEEKLYG